MEKKYNYTYQTKNMINGKTYIGVHSTNNLDDGYMGSGKQLIYAIAKYGKENFITIILCFFDTSEEAYEEEKFLVTEEWVKRKDTYNITLGGVGGDTYRYKTEDELKKIINNISNKLKGKNNPFYGKKHSEELQKQINDSLKKRYRTDLIPWNKNKNYFIGENNPFYGKKHSEKSKQKMSESQKNVIRTNGNKVIDTITGQIFDSIKLAAKYYGINHSTLVGYLKGRRPNKTNLKYL